MNKKLLSIFFGLSSLFTFSQTYNFNNQAEYNVWNSVSSATPLSFTYNTGSANINYVVNSSDGYQTSNQFLSKTLVSPLGNQFVATFKLLRSNLAQNTYFPLLLAPTIVGGTNPHPWRLNGNGFNPGQLQANALLGVVLINNQMGVVSRSASGIHTINLIPQFSVPVNKEVWVRLERICETKVKLEVFASADMILANRIANSLTTINDPGNSLAAAYIANCNGNSSTTSITDNLDDYTFKNVTSTCCVPTGIDGPDYLCTTNQATTFFVNASGNITDQNWTISPAGPTFTQNGTSMTVSNWNAPGTYTLTFTWTCNCEVNTLTKVVRVFDASQISPNFGYNLDKVGAVYTLTASNIITSNSLLTGPNAGFTWKLAEVTSNSINAPEIPGTQMINNAAWLGNGSTVNFAPNPYTLIDGRFYRISRTVWLDPCVAPITRSYVFQAAVGAKSTKASTSQLSLDNKSLDMVIVPNPSNGSTVNLVTTMEGMKTIQVVDQLGKVVDQFSSDATDILVDLEKLGNGMYTVNVTNGTEKITKNLVKN